MTVLDLSNNDLSTLDAACFRANGVTGVILGTYDRADPPKKMREAGLKLRQEKIDIIAWYGLVYFGDPHGVRRDCDWAIELAQEFKVPIVAMDVETDALDNGWDSAPRPTPSQRVEQLLTVRKSIEAAHLQPWVYTYRSWWMNQMGNTKAFSDLPLWFANYGANDATQPPIREVDFGGWTKLVGHQFTSTLSLCGRNRDANYLYKEDAVLPLSFRVLTAIAWGDGVRMNASYLALRHAGFLVDNHVDNVSDLNAFMVKRGQLAELAVSDNAEAAYKVIK